MGEDDKAQLITPPHSLKDKVGTGGPGAVGPEALERAEQVIANLADNYLEWVQTDLARIHTAWEALRAAKEGRKEILEEIYQVAHDMKGQGGSFGYNLITAVGNQLCRFIEGRQDANPAEVQAIKLHIDTMNLIIARRLEGDGGTEGAAVLAGLEQVVAKVAG